MLVIIQSMRWISYDQEIIEQINYVKPDVGSRTTCLLFSIDEQYFTSQTSLSYRHGHEKVSAYGWRLVFMQLLQKAKASWPTKALRYFWPREKMLWKALCKLSKRAIRMSKIYLFIVRTNIDGNLAPIYCPALMRRFACKRGCQSSEMC